MIMVTAQPLAALVGLAEEAATKISLVVQVLQAKATRVVLQQAALMDATVVAEVLVQLVNLQQAQKVVTAATVCRLQLTVQLLLEAAGEAAATKVRYSPEQAALAAEVTVLTIALGLLRVLLTQAVAAADHLAVPDTHLTAAPAS